MISIDLEWENSRPTKSVLSVGAGFPRREVRVVYAGNVVTEISVTGEEDSANVYNF